MEQVPSIRSLFAQGREAWPRVRLGEQAFAEHVRNLGGEPDPLHAADLYLACACAQGDAHALAELDARYLAPLSGVLQRLDPSPSFVDEARQKLRAQLLVAPARIATYSGKAPLSRWLQVVALRAGLLLRKQGRELSDEPILDAISPALDPEADYLKQRCRQELKEAMQEALASLPPRERNLLKLHYVDRLRMEDTGAIYQVHASTACRWIERAHERLRRRTCARVLERLRLSPSELQSLVELVRSELDLSLRRVLEEP